MTDTMPRCPACGQPVSLTWGWCPNHSTSEDLADNEIVEILGGSVKDKHNFLKLIREYASTLSDQGLSQNPTLADVLNSPLRKNSKRLLVHWTEFEVLK